MSPQSPDAQELAEVRSIGEEAVRALSATSIATLPFRSKRRNWLGIEVWTRPFARGWIIDERFAVGENGEIYRVILIRQPSDENFLLPLEGPLERPEYLDSRNGEAVTVDLRALISSGVANQLNGEQAH